jgi:ribosomal protein L34E
MAKFDINKSPVELTCPKGKTKIKKALGWFQQKGSTCPGCGAKFDATQLAGVTQKVNKSVEKLQHKIKSLNRRLGGK